MKTKYFDLFVESTNFILINYALSNIAMLFKTNMLFILFFASEIWLIGNYWKKANELSQSKAISIILLLICSMIHLGLIYFIGRVVGEIVPFYQ